MVWPCLSVEALRSDCSVGVRRPSVVATKVCFVRWLQGVGFEPAFRMAPILRDLRARCVAAVGAVAMPANYNETNKTVFNNRTMPAHVSFKQEKEENNGKTDRQKPGICTSHRRSERAACWRQARTRVRRSLLSHQGHISEPLRRHGLFLRHPVYPLVQASFGQVPGRRQHREIRPTHHT